MVVNKKQNLPGAPHMVGSRTNSTQSLPRAKATSNSKPISTAGPSPSSPNKKSKLKKHSKSSKHHKSSSTVDRLIVYLLAAFSVYALWTCPSDTHLSSPLCRSLSQYRTHVLDPYVLPPIQKALSHPSIAPAVAQFKSAERVVTPVVLRTRAAAQPYITRATKAAQVTAATTYEKVVAPVYTKYIHPSLQTYVFPQYTRHVLPYVQLVQSRVIDPYWTPFTLQTHIYVNRALLVIHKIYIAVTPRVQAAYTHVLPHIDRAWQTVKPHVLNAAETSAKVLGLALEKFGEARRQFVDPHVIRIWAKVIELSGSTTASSTFVAASTAPSGTAVSTTAVETTTASSEAEPETTTSSTSSVESVTISTTSTVVAVATESISEAVVPEEPPIPVETIEIVLEETVAPSVTSAESETPTTSSTSSLAAETFQSEPADSEDPVEAEAKVEVAPEDDDLEEFFAELGFDEDEQIEVEEPTTVEEPEPTNLTPEEAAEARRVKTAKKRAELESRLEKWRLDLDGLIKRRTKAFRKELVRVRKGAVRALFPDPEKDNSDLEEALTHIRGEDVAGVLGRFEKESEKLLKGLESYLKKEEKAVNDASTVDFDERMRRWYNVVAKVEERFTERLTELQEKVHWWYLEVRELEVQEYHRATTEVKHFAQKAQGDMGMPMAWLDDVTYQDWQKYHDLMRAHEKFDEQIRFIQNGSHPSPPIDPLVPALDKLQLELQEVQSGFNSRIRSLGLQIHEILAPKPVQETGEVPVAGDESEEEQVSILPLDPSPSAPVERNEGEFDASNVIIRKSKEQVEEAMSNAQEHIHEEL
ncbi:hypothetical protein GYMLUDRAFT_84649 [Collybiopsis luxurians FD-317 M1]|uniref:Uncharacterized protein n=1 Tax=Collybiopsis luxurians FD-317 M1 TaxID=944289 RepID=A0A0D0CRW3_9AGAR|nr:hypothetical protein GYMLUDRAFT_84649 [Collybiopsis luxurians FD-317 M1]